MTVVAIVERMPLEKHGFDSTADSIEATVEYVRESVSISRSRRFSVSKRDTALRYLR